MSDLENIGGLLDKCIETSRGLSRELNPAILRHLGLAAALKSLALQMREQFGPKVDLRVHSGYESAPRRGTRVSPIVPAQSRAARKVDEVQARKPLRAKPPLLPNC